MQGIGSWALTNIQDRKNANTPPSEKRSIAGLKHQPRAQEEDTLSTPPLATWPKLRVPDFLSLFPKLLLYPTVSWITTLCFWEGKIQNYFFFVLNIASPTGRRSNLLVTVEARCLSQSVCILIEIVHEISGLFWLLRAT